MESACNCQSELDALESRIDFLQQAVTYVAWATMSNGECKTGPPVLLVSNPGAGYVIVPTCLIMQTNYGGTSPWTNEPLIGLSWGGIDLINDIDPQIGDFTGTVTSMRQFIMPSETGGELTQFAGELRVELKPPLTGSNDDNTITWYVYYHILQVH